MIHYIDGSQLTSEILKSEKIVLAGFCMDNSIPCKKQFEILKDIEKELNEKIEVFKIDITEKSQDTKVLYNITSVPTIVFFNNNTEIERKVGLQNKDDLVKIINELRIKIKAHTVCLRYSLFFP